MNESSHRDNAQARGKGSVGKDLPMNSSSNHAEDMGKSMPDTGMGALETGYTEGGSIAGSTKSHPAMSGPGSNNKNHKSSV